MVKVNLDRGVVVAGEVEGIYESETFNVLRGGGYVMVNEDIEGWEKGEYPWWLETDNGEGDEELSLRNGGWTDVGLDRADGEVWEWMQQRSDRIAFYVERLNQLTIKPTRIQVVDEEGIGLVEVVGRVELWRYMGLQEGAVKPVQMRKDYRNLFMQPELGDWGWTENWEKEEWDD